MLKVMPGDTVAISANAFYNIDKTLPGKGLDAAPVLGSAVAAMSNPASALLGEVAQLVADLGTVAGQSAALKQLPEDDSGEDSPQPESGVNFVLYNQKMEVIPENTGILAVEDQINTIQQLSSDRMIMQEAGFLEIFINNDAQTSVYYDNLSVTYWGGFVLEYNTCYPYGGLIPGLSAAAAPEDSNAYKFSAKELETALNLNWGNHGARVADYTIGVLVGS
jgi:hypothetical protein